MEIKTLVKKLKHFKNKDVVIKIENSLYYPIKDIREEKSHIVIEVTDIEKAREETMPKFYPNVGDPLYLHQKTGDMWVDQVKTPYTVIAVTKQHVVIQSAKLIFNGPRYYNTVASDIQPDPEGEILTLNWAPRKECWQIDKYQTGYPEIAVFGRYEHYPYLN